MCALGERHWIVSVVPSSGTTYINILSEALLESCLSVKFPTRMRSLHLLHSDYTHHEQRRFAEAASDIASDRLRIISKAQVLECKVFSSNHNQRAA